MVKNILNRGNKHLGGADVQNVQSSSRREWLDSHEKDYSRVSRKCLTFLLLSIVPFALLSLISLNLLSINPIITIVIALVYIVFSSIFYVIVSRKSYVYLFLLAHVLVFAGFSLVIATMTSISWIALVLILVLLWLGYRDVEKIQLSSRLFFVNQVTKPAVRVFELIVLIVLAMGFFNSMIGYGYSKFISDKIVDNNLFKSNVLFSKNSQVYTYTDNYLGVLSYEEFRNSTDDDSAVPTYRDYLMYYYSNSNPTLLSIDEKNSLDSEFRSSEDGKVAAQVQLIDSKLQSFAVSKYGEMAYDLSQPIAQEEFINLTKKDVVSSIDQFSTNNTDGQESDITSFLSNFLFIPQDNIVPAFFTLLMLAFVFLIKFIFNSINWVIVSISGISLRVILWNILKYMGYVHVEVEDVEAEVVSI